MFYGWGYGMGISWLITEPFVILILASLPSFCRCKFVEKCFNRMDEMGLNAEVARLRACQAVPLLREWMRHGQCHERASRGGGR